MLIHESPVQYPVEHFSQKPAAPTVAWLSCLRSLHFARQGISRFWCREAEAIVERSVFEALARATTSVRFRIGCSSGIFSVFLGEG